MSLPIALISTDFDGTLFAEFENPPVPDHLQDLIADLQKPGRQMGHPHGASSSLMDPWAGPAADQAGFSRPRGTGDFVHEDSRISGDAGLDQGIREPGSRPTCSYKSAWTLPAAVEWVEKNFASATVYEDPVVAFCLIRKSRAREAITRYLRLYCRVNSASDGDP